MTLDLARWQFALTSINHFFFVPVTIGLAFLVAVLQTAWHRSAVSGDPEGRPPETPRSTDRGDDPPKPPAALTRGDDPPKPPAVLTGGTTPRNPPQY